MNEIKAKTLIYKERCKRKAEFNELLNYKTNSFSEVKKILVSMNSDYKDALSSILDQESFLLSQQKEIYKQQLFFKIDRYLKYQSARDIKVISQNISLTTTIKNFNIRSHVDLILEEKGVIEVIKFKRSEPELSKRARKIENKPFCSVELYLMWKAAKDIFKGKEVKAAFYHLQNKDDKSSELVGSFENKEGKNIVSVNFDKEEYNPHDRVINLLMNEQAYPYTSTSADECDKCSFKSICSFDEYSTLNMSEDRSNQQHSFGKLTLTAKQQEAIESEDPFIRLIACAGAGKTMTLTQRVLKLLEKGRKEENILLITFTNQAAEEMKNKIKGINPDIDLDKINIMTFNGFGMWLIKKYYKRIGYKKQPRLISKVEKVDLILKLLEKHKNLPYLNYKDPIANYRNYKGAAVQVMEFFEQIQRGNFEKTEIKEDMLELYEKYETELLENNLIDYGQQIIRAIQICETLKKGALSFTDIMVDESQDNNDKQLELIRYVYNICKMKTILFCGDPDQTIYTFQGAKVENLVNLLTKFVYHTNKGVLGLTDIILDKNYRSTSQILSAAHNIISKNEMRVDKALISGNNKQGIPPVLLEFDDKEEKYNYIANSIRNAKGTVAVLARTNHELDKLSEFLKGNDIKFKHVRNHTFLENKYVNLIISYARALYDIEDELAIAEIVYVFTRTVCKQNIETYKKQINAKSKDIESFISLAESLAVDDISKLFVEHLKDQKFKDLPGVNSYLQKMIAYNEDSKIENVIEPSSNIIFITAHQAKGKEYDMVYLLLDKFEANDELLEEERRLLFVAMTRAKEKLEMLVDKKKSNLILDEIRNLGPSIFKDELLEKEA